MIELLDKISYFKQLNSEINKDNFNLYVYNSTQNNDLISIYKLFLEQNKSIVYVCPNIYKATTCYEELVTLAGIENVNFYVMDDFTTGEVLASSPEYKEERLFTIASIINNEKKIIVANIQAILRPLLPLKQFIECVLTLKEGKEIKIDELVSTLLRGGYKKVSKVEKMGEFSLRGEVLDLFALGEDMPIRVDFFDEEIEYIKYFDVQTQRTITHTPSISIYPVTEIIIKDKDKVIEKIRADQKGIESSHIEDDITSLSMNDGEIRGLKYINYYCKDYVSFLDYLDEKIVAYQNVKDIIELELHLNEDALSCFNDEELKNMNFLFYIPLMDSFNKSSNIFFSPFKSYFKIPLTGMIDAGSCDVYSYHGNVSSFLKDVSITDEVNVLIHDEKRYKFVSDILSLQESGTSNIHLLKDKAISVDYLEKDHHIKFISEESLFKKDIEKNKKYRSISTITINSHEELESGDYVVHFDYGIAKYVGLKTLELNGIKNDYLMLHFENQDLYVPVENIGILDKYQGTEGHIPHLSKIGTNKWEKKKAEVREKLKEIASDLIKTQAKRDSSFGIKYDIDSNEQELFESDFEYELTIDQDETIKTIKKEMEEGKIIDRLICGDVGYGKTEVAMRIAFKTVMQGKQVAYLAPTTILTRQHYFSFFSRMEKYGINVALINRFVTQSEITNIVAGLKSGSIDIVIGTHALLNDSITYKDLGLLIVDEEQRFGVEHKEKIKKLKENINVLTLSATPIPRTLQMSLVGVRDLSLISTPPKNRFPVKTYVLEENDVVIKEAIYQEIARGGQVFYLHNKVSDIEIIKKKLERLVPEARIAIGHGQMDKDMLEDVIQAFIDREVDILLCTTIIETGIDMPNSNTLIVDGAERLGLAQMYQLRGRVGRSDRLSYAYFTYSKKGVLPENSVKRLQAIKEFTALGSGYKIALRDLSIRGAGDILGCEQSGFIDDVGMDLYMRLLDMEVKKINGQKLEEIKPQTWQVNVNKHVDDEYVNDEDIKIYIHKRINDITSFEEKEELIKELEDRFGRLNEEMLLYIEKKYLDVLAYKANIEKVNDYITYFLLSFSQEKSNSMDASSVFSVAYNLSSNFSFEYKDKRIIVKYNKKKDKMECLKTINSFLEGVCKL